MMSTFRNRDFIYCGVIAITLFALLMSVRGNITKRKEIGINNQNIVALTDSIKTYSAKNGNLVAEKTILEGDMETLKMTNEKLYAELKNMKVKNADLAAYVSTLINNPTIDTCWQLDIKYKDVEPFSQPFNFDNDFRKLNGQINFANSTLGLKINEDKMICDYSLAIKDNKVYMTSNNPYIEYREIYGLTIPKEKPKNWNLGIAVGFGLQYGIIGRGFDVGPCAALCLSYGIPFRIF